MGAASKANSVLPAPSWDRHPRVARLQAPRLALKFGSHSGTAGLFRPFSGDRKMGLSPFGPWKALRWSLARWLCRRWEARRPLRWSLSSGCACMPLLNQVKRRQVADRPRSGWHDVFPGWNMETR